MSRWLKSVNNLLESLDGTAGTVVSDPSIIPTSRGAIGQILSARGMDYDDDDEEFDDDEYEDDEDYDDDEDLENQMTEGEDVVEFSNSPDSYEGVIVADHEPEPAVPPPPPMASNVQSVAQENSMLVQSLPPPPVSVGGYASDYTSDGAVIVNKRFGDVESVTTEEPSSPPTQTEIVSPPRSSANMVLPTRSPPPSGVSTTTTSADKVQQQLKKYKLELKKAQTETRQLRKHVMQLNEELESSEAEVKAQQAELTRAAERMEKDRARHNEDREELLDEQEDELENQKAQYEKELKEQKERYEDQVEELEERLAVMEQKRMQEGGDWTKELEETIQREREAIKKLNSVKDENSKLKSALMKLETQQSALQAKLESSIEANHTASDREREAEDRLDAALSLHSRQLSQRQSREAELERAIADLGAALARSRQKEKTGTVQRTDSSSMKEHLEVAIDELEMVRAQLVLESERSEALRNELHDLSKERTAEMAESQARQRQLTREVSDLKSTVSRLQASTRDRKGAVAMDGDSDASEVLQQLEEAKMQMSLLSEQLMKQQTADQHSKQEIMALKARLQTAASRAESAENALVTATSGRSTFEIEGGTAYPGASMRRRVKGGRTHGQANVRSIRTSLGIRPGHVNDGMEQLAVTVDAIDGFLIDTGSLMKKEPLLRLGFVLYLCILHLWSFCLVVFHASSYEDVHGDFGSMSDPDAISSLLRNNQP